MDLRLKTYGLEQGFPTVFFSRTPKQKNLKFAYPLVRISNVSLKILVPFLIVDDFAYPFEIFHVPLGVHVPQVGNRWLRAYFFERLSPKKQDGSLFKRKSRKHSNP